MLVSDLIDEFLIDCRSRRLTPNNLSGKTEVAPFTRTG